MSRAAGLQRAAEILLQHLESSGALAEFSRCSGQLLQGLGGRATVSNSWNISGRLSTLQDTRWAHAVVAHGSAMLPAWHLLVSIPEMLHGHCNCLHIACTPTTGPPVVSSFACNQPSTRKVAQADHGWSGIASNCLLPVDFNLKSSFQQTLACVKAGAIDDLSCHLSASKKWDCLASSSCHAFVHQLMIPVW